MTMSEILLISVLILEKRVPAISRFIVRLFCAFAEIKINRKNSVFFILFVISLFIV